MINYATNDKKTILDFIRRGEIDAVSISSPTFVDEIILHMHERGILESLGDAIKDKRRGNKSIPLSIILTLAIAAKMKLKTALTDVPFAINDAELLSAIGINLYDSFRDFLTQGIYEEGVTRNIINKYEAKDFIQFYNTYIKDFILGKHVDQPTIHILDCTKVTVNLDNDKYEKSEVVKIDGKPFRGYKLASLRGLLDTSGIIEEVEIGSIKTHDLKLSKHHFKITSSKTRGYTY